MDAMGAVLHSSGLIQATHETENSARASKDLTVTSPISNDHADGKVYDGSTLLEIDNGQTELLISEAPQLPVRPKLSNFSIFKDHGEAADDEAKRSDSLNQQSSIHSNLELAEKSIELLRKGSIENGDNDDGASAPIPKDAGEKDGGHLLGGKL